METTLNIDHEKEVDAEKHLYLFYEHMESSPHMEPSPNSYSLYKIDIHLPTTTTTTTTLFPPRRNTPPPNKILNFPKDKFPAKGMRCARLGSKIYFLGGTNTGLYGPDRDIDKLFPRDVYEFNILTGEFKKMDAQLNSGKPHPCALFAAKGKLYALGTNGYNWGFLASLSLFESYDPVSNKWQPIENFAFAIKEGTIYWQGCAVLEKHKKVIVVASTSSNFYTSSIKFVCDLVKERWTRQNLSDKQDGKIAVSILEGGGDDFYFLGELHQPLKSKKSCITYLNEWALYSGYGCSSEDLVKISQVSEYFYQPHDDYWATESLIYLGNDCFCYVASGMLPDCKDDDDDDDFDPYTREVLLTLFKELKGDDEKLCFEAQILDFAYHTIKMPQDDKFCNEAQLVASFIITPELLHKNKNEKRKQDKKKKKKKKIRNLRESEEKQV